MKPLVLVPPVLFAALGALFYVGMQRDDPTSLPTTFAGKPAPAVTAMPFAEALPPTDALLRDGDVKLINFWASWCAPCRQEHPLLEQLAEEGVEIVGINYKDVPQNARGFLEELGNPFSAIGTDAGGRMGLDWGVYGVPETFLVDGSGTIIARIAGPVTAEDAATVLRPALPR